MFEFFRKSKQTTTYTEAAAVDMEERRREGRRNVYADIMARSDGGRQTKRGIVLDLSAHGARLRLEHGDMLVDGMLVRIPRYGITVPARVRWSSRQDIGVEFVN